MRSLVSTAFLVMVVTPAWSYNYGNSYPDTLETKMLPVGSQYTARPEAQVQVDRKVLSREDYLSDPSVLISGVRDMGPKIATGLHSGEGASPVGPSKIVYVMAVPPVEPVVTWEEE